MVQNLPYRFNSQDEKIIKVFTDLGMPKNLAKTLIYISQVNECPSVEIEHGANLRQPEVNVVIHELQRKGWIKKRNLNKKGKGRPVHLYQLTSTINEIVSNFEKEKMREIKHVQDGLEQLKALISDR